MQNLTLSRIIDALLQKFDGVAVVEAWGENRCSTTPRGFCHGASMDLIGTPRDFFDLSNFAIKICFVCPVDHSPIAIRIDIDNKKGG